MIWTKLSIVVLALGYVLWVVWRGRRLFRGLTRADTAGDVLKNVMEQRRFYFIQGMSSTIVLSVFLGVKALVLFFKPSPATIFGTIVFGDFANRFLLGKLGLLGLVLLAIPLVCFYQHIKSKHYLDVLYTFRSQLELGDPDKSSTPEPAAAALAERPII